MGVQNFISFGILVWLSRSGMLIGTLAQSNGTSSSSGNICGNGDGVFKAAVQNFGNLHNEIAQVASYNPTQKADSSYLGIIVGIQQESVILESIFAGSILNGTACLSHAQSIVNVIGAAIGHANDNCCQQPFTGDDQYHDLVKRYGAAQVTAGQLSAACGASANSSTPYLQELVSLANVSVELGGVLGTNDTGAACQKALKDLSTNLNGELQSVK